MLLLCIAWICGGDDVDVVVGCEVDDVVGVVGVAMNGIVVIGVVGVGVVDVGVVGVDVAVWVVVGFCVVCAVAVSDTMLLC